MPTLVTICARKNSERLPGKNTKLLHGKPLFQWTFDVAKELPYQVVVSSDDERILTTAKFMYQWPVIKRPAHLDDVGKMAQIRDAVTIMEHRMSLQYDPIIDLDITNPMKAASDVENALNLFQKTLERTVRPAFGVVACSVVSVTRARKLPYFNQIPTHDLPRVDTYDMNAAIYVYSRGFLMENDHPVKNLNHTRTALYHMPEWTFCDIDYILDFRIVEFLMKEYGYVEKAQDQA